MSEQLPEPEPLSDTPVFIPPLRIYGIFEHDDFADNLTLGWGTDEPPLEDAA